MRTGMTQNDVKDCSTCVFSEPMISDEENEGPLLKCLRYPPTLMRIGQELIQVNPDANTKCGEYQEQRSSDYVVWKTSNRLLVRLFKKGY